METKKAGVLEKIVAGCKQTVVVGLIGITVLAGASCVHDNERVEYAHVPENKPCFARQVAMTYMDVKEEKERYVGEIPRSVLIYDLDGDNVADQVFEIQGDVGYYKNLIFLTTDKWKNYVAIESDSTKAADLQNRLLIDNNITSMTDVQREAYTRVLNLGQ